MRDVRIRTSQPTPPSAFCISLQGPRPEMRYAQRSGVGRNENGDSGKCGTMRVSAYSSHRLTAPPHHHHAVKQPDRRPPCLPIERLSSAAPLPAESDALAAVLPSVGEATAAAAADNSPSSSIASGSAGGAGYGSVSYPNGPGLITGTPPGPPISPVAPVTQPAGVPEPASWMMMISGFLGVGMLCRRRSPEKPAKRALGAGAIVGLLSSGTLGPTQTAAMAGAKASSALGGPFALAIAAVCVCSGAILATAVTTIPPLKRSVFAATLPVRTLASGNCGPHKQ